MFNLKTNSQTQQTPNPEAQLPSLVPPFAEHSSLKFYNNLMPTNNYLGLSKVHNYLESLF